MGDQHNEAFGFVSFFPKRLHPAVTVATTACFRVAEHCPCCATLHEQKRKVVNVMKHQALPGHTQSEAGGFKSRVLQASLEWPRSRVGSSCSCSRPRYSGLGFSLASDE